MQATELQGAILKSIPKISDVIKKSDVSKSHYEIGETLGDEFQFGFSDLNRSRTKI